MAQTSKDTPNKPYYEQPVLPIVEALGPHIRKLAEQEQAELQPFASALETWAVLRARHREADDELFHINNCLDAIDYRARNNESISYHTRALLMHTEHAIAKLILLGVAAYRQSVYAKPKSDDKE